MEQQVGINHSLALIDISECLLPFRLRLVICKQFQQLLLGGRRTFFSLEGVDFVVDDLSPADSDMTTVLNALVAKDVVILRDYLTLKACKEAEELGIRDLDVAWHHHRDHQ